MPVKKPRKTKTGGARKCKSKCKVGGALTQSGSALYQSQSGRGFLGSVLPGPLGMIANMIGLGKKPTQAHKAKLHSYLSQMQRGGIDPMEYVRALVRAVGPIASRDLGL
jgi:hypothetical protein